MTLFLHKRSSVVPRVLDEWQCPPHDDPHTIELYPNYYDSLYYPELHACVYASASSFCAWLQTSLSSHLASCPHCGSIRRRISMTSDGTSLCIGVDGLSLNFSRAYFETEMYHHCAVFIRYFPILSVHLPSISQEEQYRLNSACDRR